MTDLSPPAALDRDRIRELFDLRSSYNSFSGGDYTDDPYPVWHELRARAAVHEGTVHRLTGYPGEAMFQGLPFPDRPHFSVFGFEACDAAFRDSETFASSPVAINPIGDDVGVMNSMLSMGGDQHRRYRALVQPSFVPAKAKWWIVNWIQETVQDLVDRIAGDGRAELNTDFCAAIPVLTITGSFGVPVDQALVIRESLRDPAAVVRILAPIVAARRESPSDDLISVLVQAELKEADGTTHTLSDAEIYSFAILLLTAGSGTTWKQMGITLTALLQRPEVLAAVREDRTLLKACVEESVRWLPTDPMFSRHVTRDVDFYGTTLPKGSVLHMCLGAAGRDPERWDRPDEFDPYRPLKRSLGFGGGPHICLGMHLARAEITTGINALLDRLPNLRLDPDAEQPRYVGLYERGATEIPVLFG
ncbi:cytochrome P450 [Frankia sp. CNm7]|uniref:Cytochrome P450 n=1 Tax=Frankia nepalensis TaxID=1836974 RepID=A0A937RCP8_9ACTN|nr:cytochrome P450 [Frankia nepalensis]MBL7494779.1 cytochrome P450 [Frankia nepalensis]MBL7514064.1 cytochrome P450 [Frankia nepalensis]MBL7521160.1 cytochrome P450 [Frankia nepalensis]MBL7626479.1 cytochrome P450 [Frankia nepalensis]